jgi:NADH-quinone oxidoreductase subunit L
MTVPLIVLAVLSTVGGFIGVPYALSSVFSHNDLNVIERTLEPAIAKLPSDSHAKPEVQLETPLGSDRESASPIHELPTAKPAEVHHDPAEISAERLLAVVSVVIALIGMGIGWLVFRKRPLLQMPTILENKYYVDEIYDAALIHPIEAVSREGLWKIIDIGVIDGLLHSLGGAVTDLGRLARYLQAGFVRGYAAIILTGALILIGIFAYVSILR